MTAADPAGRPGDGEPQGPARDDEQPGRSRRDGDEPRQTRPPGTSETPGTPGTPGTPDGSGTPGTPEPAQPPDESAGAEWSALLARDVAGTLEEIRAAVSAGGPSPAEIARWRRTMPPSRVTTAIELIRGRRSLEGRFPEADRMLADPAGAAMATGEAAASAKADRLAAARPREIWDLGCGIGGDAMRLARIPGLERLVLVDRDPDRLAMARHNVRLVSPRVAVETRCDDIERCTPVAAPGLIVHVDPARRDERGRRHRGLSGLQPDADALATIIDRAGDVVLKLGPGIDPPDVPRPEQATLEYVAHDRTLVQALAWYGRLAGTAGTVRATIVPAGVTLAAPADRTMDPPNLEPPPDRPRAWCDRAPAFLLVPHPAVERARLVSAALAASGMPLEDVRPLAAGLGILAARQAPDSPWFESIAIVEAMPWREQRVRRRLAELDTGEVIVRTRGGAVDPDQAARGLRGRGGVRRSVAILRLGRETVAFLGDALT